VRVGRILGCTVKVSPWLLVALAGWAAWGNLPAALIAYGLLLTHELAHLVVARGFGLHIEEVELWPFGGVARVPGLAAAEPAVVAVVALAGPLHHFLLAGLGELLQALGLPAAPVLPALPYRKIFAQGFLTNVLNPKVALFFLAFVPQFISLDAPNKALAFVILGCIFNVNGMLWCGFLAVSTAKASERLKLNPTVSLWLNRATGGLFVWLGVKLALSKQH